MSEISKRRVALGATLLMLSACALGPDYKRPDLDIPAGFKEQAGWKISEPTKADSNHPWWAIFNDPELDQLERQVDVSNQTIKASEAAYRQAVAASDAATAALFPTISLDGSATRSKTAGTSRIGPTVANDIGLSAGASWVLDIWGKLRRQEEAAQAQAVASEGDLAGARLTEQAALATDYFTLRSTDQLLRLLDAAVAAYTKSLDITRNQYKSGTAAKSDVAQAESQLETTRAQFISAGIQRAQLEHAIAVLVGKPPAEFSLAAAGDLGDPPEVPVMIPSALLERRPDIAAAEANVTAANAQIGVAITAFFPSITLSGSYGYQNTAFSNLLNASHNVWSFGPSMAETLFNGGALNAQLAQARAAYDQQVANYRLAVLTAFQGVEDQLNAVSTLVRQQEAEDHAVASASEAERLILNQYRAGTVAYTSVVTAQTAALTARESALTIRQNRLLDTVTLIQDLGGGWAR